jgi:hypothetical protein
MHLESATAAFFVVFVLHVFGCGSRRENNKMTKHFGSAMAGTLIGLLLGSISSGGIARAQVKGQDPAVSSTDGSSNDSDPNATADRSATTGADPANSSAAISEPTTEAPLSKTESSLFTSLFMAGKTQDQFEPLTAKERLVLYAKDLFGPFHLLMAGFSAGITQLQDSPKQWGEGAQGYGIRYANYYGYATVSSILQMGGEDLLHEDNLYYGSGERGVWRRVKYAVKSSVLARGSDGTQHFSVSQVGSTAAAAFISRLWQPPGDRSATNGAESFGISMATNAGVNVAREFLPDITRHLFHKSAGGQ